MKKLRNFWFPAAALGLLLLLLSGAEDAADAARAGLELALHTAVPALLPFFVASALLVKSGLAAALGRALARPVFALYSLGGGCAAALVLGLVGGYPVGAQTTCNLYRARLITKKDAERLLGFCNNSGPAFILGVAGVAVCGSAQTGAMLYAIHAAAALLCGLALTHAPAKGACPPPLPADRRAAAPAHEGTRSPMGRCTPARVGAAAPAHEGARSPAKGAGRRSRDDDEPVHAGTRSPAKGAGRRSRDDDEPVREGARPPAGGAGRRSRSGNAPAHEGTRSSLPPAARESAPTAFVSAVQEGFSTCITVTAFLTFFSVLLALLRRAGILGALASVLAPLLGVLGVPAGAADALLCGAVELTCGLAALPPLALPPRVLLPLVSFLLGFGGLSVHCQTLSLVQRCGLSARRHALGKLLHGTIAAALTVLVTHAAPQSVPVFAPQNVPAASPLAVGIPMLAVIVIVLFTKNTGILRKNQL